MIDELDKRFIRQHVSNVQDIIAVAQKTADFLMQYRKDHPNMAVSLKSDNSPVTEADKGASTIAVSGLNALSNLPVVSEENGVRARGLRLFWVVDPLDGTTQYSNDETGFSVNIALMYRKTLESDAKPILGVVACPALESVYYSTLDNKSFVKHNDEAPRQLKTRTADLDHLAIGINKSSSPDDRIYRRTRKRLKDHFKLPADPIDVGDIIPHLLVAEGCLDAYLKLGRDKTLKGSGGFIWDNAALEPIITGAGGKFVSLRNHKESLHYKGRSIRQHGYAVVGDATQANRLCSPTLAMNG